MEKTTEELIQEITKSVKEYNENLAKAQKALDDKADKVYLDEVKSLLKDQGDKIIALGEQADKIQLAQKDRPLPQRVKAWQLQVADILRSDEVKGMLKEHKSAPKDFVITCDPLSVLKLAGDMTIDPNLGALSLETAVILPMREPGVWKAPSRPTTLLDVISRGATSSNQITWVERTARTEGAAAVSEAGAFAETDFTWNLKKGAVEKIGTYTRFSNESLDDWEYTLSEINTELLLSLQRKLEYEVAQGTGSAPHLNGLLGDSSNYSAYTYTGITNIPLVNLRDIVTALKTQIAKYYFNATHVMMNIADYAKFKLSKDTLGRYLFDVGPDGGVTIDGLEIIQTYDDIMAAGYIYVFDATKPKLFLRRDITLEMFDQDASDAQYDRRMIRAKVRACLRFRACDQYSAIYDTIANVTTAIQGV